MKYKNLIKKYEIKEQDLRKALLSLTKDLAKKSIDVNVHLAIIDLLANGDIEE